MTKGFVLGTGFLVAGAAIAFFVSKGVRFHQAEDHAQEAMMEAIRTPVNWPGQALSDEPAFQQFGELDVDTNTDWETDDAGDPVLRYTVTLTPQHPSPNPGALVQVARNCRFSLALNDSQGMLVTSIPLEFSPVPSSSGSVDTLSVFGTTPMPAGVYADMVGASPEGATGVLTGAAEVAGQCSAAALPPTPPPGFGPGRDNGLGRGR